ncbi:MAG: heparan-alpha-glucosaminide N-acetyltransferase [Thermoplasmata archaeon]
MHERKHEKRFWEIDSFRGIAIVMMITFHSFFDLYYLADHDIDVGKGPLFILARSTATIFIFLVGLSLTLSHSKAVKKGLTRDEIVYKYLKRGLKIFSFGVLISAATWIFIPEGFVVFGILHFIGVSIPLAYLFLRFEKVNLITGSVFIILGFFIKNIKLESPWFLWLGLKPVGFYTVDYFPLLPWFGVILFGIYFGNLLYPNGKRTFDLPMWDDKISIKFISFLGKHSLILYIFHQPVIISLMLLSSIIELNQFY